MFIIDKENNNANPIESITFKELGFGERKHLQEWISKEPLMLGEELLIIQKEFADFDDTNERLDLLALDKNGDLVIIENKLDDSGKDVTWQALKYVSYCSGLTKSDIIQIYQKYLGTEKNAEQEICLFFEQDDIADISLNEGDQRIILVSANYRKEVTSTVMWLLEHNIRIKCIKVTPYKYQNNIFIDTEQIIPIKDAEEYIMKLANKKLQENLSIANNKEMTSSRLKFWNRLLQKMNEQSELFRNVTPSKENYISCGSGVSGIVYCFAVTKSHVRVEIYINKETKEIFDNLYKSKDKIEEKFGAELDWERKDDKKGSRIANYLNNISIVNENEWDEVIKLLVDKMVKFEKIFKIELKSIINP